MPVKIINGFIVLSAVIVLYGCSNQKQKTAVNLEGKRTSNQVSVNFWFDKETNTVHKFISENGEERVISIIKYKDRAVLEKMIIVKSRFRDGHLQWAYFVPTTKYIVELNALSLSGDSISVNWTNKNARGEVSSGADVLVRCNEDGSIIGEYDKSVK